MSSAAKSTAVETSTVFGRSTSRSSNEDVDDEEFFECLEDSEKTDASKPTDLDSGNEGEVSMELSPNVFTDTRSTMEPEGRLRQHGELRLLNVDEMLYVPVTQEPAPMTEDMLEEHAEVLAR